MFIRRTSRAASCALSFLAVAFLASRCAPAATGPAAPPQPQAPGDVELNLQLNAEKDRLGQLQQQLDRMEQYVKEGTRRRDLGAAKEAFSRKPLADAPASIATEDLHVDRTEGENGLIYTVSARNASLLQVLEAVSKTAGLRLEIHPDVPHDRLMNRVWIDLKAVEMTELLQIAVGMQSLDVMSDMDGIVVGLPAALSDRAATKRVWDLCVEAYQLALSKYPAGPEAPVAYLGIARRYAAEDFPTAAIQTARNILDRWPQAPAAAPALLLIANCHEALHEYEAARGCYYRYEDLYPAAEDGPAVLTQVAETWIREGKWAQAVPVLEETVRQWPKSDVAPIARMRMAQCLAEQGHYEQAVSLFELVEREYSAFLRKDELNLAAAECLMKLKRYGAARVRLAEVLERSPSAERAERAAYALGDSLLAEGRSVAALEVYRGAARRFPEGLLYRQARLSQARAYIQMGLYSAAEHALKTAPDSLPSAEIRPVLLALANHDLQDGKAERALALMADPKWPHDQDAEPEVLLLNARAVMGSGLVAPALEKSTLAATLAKDPETRAQACGLAGECRRLMNEPVLAAMAYGGKTQ